MRGFDCLLGLDYITESDMIEALAQTGLHSIDDMELVEEPNIFAAVNNTYAANTGKKFEPVLPVVTVRVPSDEERYALWKRRQIEKLRKKKFHEQATKERKKKVEVAKVEKKLEEDKQDIRRREIEEAKRRTSVRRKKERAELTDIYGVPEKTVNLWNSYSDYSKAFMDNIYKYFSGQPLTDKQQNLVIDKLLYMHNIEQHRKERSRNWRDRYDPAEAKILNLIIAYEMAYDPKDDYQIQDPTITTFNGTYETDSQIAVPYVAYLMDLFNQPFLHIPMIMTRYMKLYWYLTEFFQDKQLSLYKICNDPRCNYVTDALIYVGQSVHLMTLTYGEEYVYASIRAFKKVPVYRFNYPDAITQEVVDNLRAKYREANKEGE